MKKLYSIVTALLLGVLAMNAQNTVPFKQVFDHTGCLAGWSVPSPDSERAKFQFFAAGASPYYNSSFPGAGSRALYAAYSGEKNSWLITPSISLEKDVTYKVKYVYSSSNGFRLRLAVFYGMEATIQGMTNKVIDDFYWGQGFYPENNYMTLECEFTPTASGVYYIGLADLTDAYSSASLLITEMSVTAAASGTMPSEPTDFKITPAANGALSVVLSAKAPTVDASGAELTSLTALEFLRGGEVINTVQNPTKGQTYTYTDNSPINGNNTYAVRAVNQDGCSNEVEEVVNVGLNIPGKMLDVSAYQVSSGVVKFGWVKPEGDIFGNGFVDKSLVKAKIEVYEDGKVVKTFDNLSGDSFEVQLNNPSSSQIFYTAKIYAVTTGGESIPLTIPAFPAGKIEGLPYSENFAGGQAHNPLYISSNERYTATWEYVTINGGAARFTANGIGAIATLYSGSIALDAGSHNLFSFKYTGMTGNSDHSVNVLINADGNWVTVGEYRTSTADWQNATIDLSAYAGKNIQYAIQASLGSGGYNVMVTDININSAADYDLGFSNVDFPYEIERYTTAQAKLTVTNYGLKTVDSYTVTLYTNNSVSQPKTFGPIESGASQEITLDLVTNQYTTDVVTYYAVIKCADDKNSSNDTTARQTVKVINSESGLDSVITDSEQTAVYYDLLGRRVDSPVNGKIYIKVVNGVASKVLVK